jgi:hypothetical protein
VKHGSEARNSKRRSTGQPCQGITPRAKVHLLYISSWFVLRCSGVLPLYRCRFVTYQNLRDIGFHVTILFTNNIAPVNLCWNVICSATLSPWGAGCFSIPVPQGTDSMSLARSDKAGPCLRFDPRLADLPRIQPRKSGVVRRSGLSLGTFPGHQV